MKKLLLICAIILIGFGKSFSATYYVDSQYGSDSNSGLLESSAFKSIAKVNALALKAGDIILFKRGGIWYETLTVKYDNITFSDYGSGALPVIDGQLTRTNNIYMTGRAGITIRNIEVKNSAGSGSIRIQNSNNILIEGCVVYATAKGIFIETSRLCTVRGVTITTPSFIDTQTDGIYSQRNKNNVYENNYIVISNTAETQHNDGIQCYLDTSTTARGNYIEQDNMKTGNAQGIYATNTSGRYLYYNNIIKTPNSMASSLALLNIDTIYTGTIEAYHNTVITKGGNALAVTNAPDFIAKNNIFISRGTTYAVTIRGRVNNPASMNHNIYYNQGTSGAAVFFEILGGTQTLPMLQSKGYELNGKFADPKLDLTYMPLDNSPVIDFGTTLAAYPLDKNGTLRPQGTSSDMGALEKIISQLVTIPSAPSALNASAVSYNQINLSWTDNSNNETGFRVERKLTSATDWTVISTTSSNVVILSDTDLAASTSYTYRVRAFNTAGNSSYSNEPSATTHSVTINAPSNLIASVFSENMIAINWTDNSGNETGFRIERKLTTGTNWTLITTTAGNIVSFQDTGLLPATGYTYRVQSFNSLSYSAFSNEASAVTLSMPVPDQTLHASSGQLFNGASTTQFSGSVAPNVVFFSSKRSYSTYSITITSPAEYFLQGRFNHVSKGSNAFTAALNNGTKQALSYNRIIGTWQWGPKISLGYLQPGTYNIKIENSKPSSDSYIDLLVIGTSGVNQYMAIGDTNTEDDLLPDNFLSSYPNPFNPETNIVFTLNKTEKVNISIYDILGNLVSEIENRDMEPGTHQINFNASHLASGVYILNLRTADQTRSLKLNLLK
jgi:hypothetical protein